MGTSQRMEDPSSFPILYLECEEEPLSLAQRTYFEKKKHMFKSQMKELKRLSMKAACISVNSESALITVPEPPPAPPCPPLHAPPLPPLALLSPQENGKYRLIMDPKTGRIIGTVDSINENLNGLPNIQTITPYGPPTREAPFQGGIPTQPFRAPGATVVRAKTASLPLVPLSPPVRPAKQILPKPLQPPKQPQRSNKGGHVPKPNPPPLLPLPTVPLPPKSVPVPSPSPKPSGSNEPTTSGTSDKAPSLVIPPTLCVVPKTLKVVPHYHAAIVRKRLDSKVKGLLVRSPSKFTEFLIRQGLIPTRHFQSLYGTKKRVELKLGIYSDEKKFPRSGGYVWINESEPNVFYSVFDGSIFNDSECSPMTVIKLIYHWACQTNVNNIVQWLKVDVNVVDKYFRMFRNICTLFESSYSKKVGGNRKKIQVGVISLGVTSPKESEMEAEVQILGVFEADTGKIRLRTIALTTEAGQSRSYKEILQILPGWIHTNSILLIDNAIDKRELVRIGFSNIKQKQVSEKKSGHGNSIIMDYLRRIVPKMFQNYLFKLSPSEIQQFLDELTFREMAYHPLVCFDSMLRQISQLTKSLNKRSKSLLKLLDSVDKFPFVTRFHPWNGDENVNATENIDEEMDSSAPRASNSSLKRSAPDLKVQDEPKKKLAKVQDLVDLQTYYYGTIPGDTKILRQEFKADMAFKCHLCRKVYFNNLDFMKHLTLHVENDRVSDVDLSDLSSCIYCTLNFETAEELKAHVDVFHFKVNMEYVCQICTDDFQWQNHLAHHMAKAHMRCELPYMCRICGYRSSNHVEVINHFHREHDRTDKIQCPKCLKDYSLMGEKGCYQSSIASAFVSHLQSHKQSKTFPCKSCNLTFLQDAYLKNHVMRDHASFHEVESLEGYVYAEGEPPIKMERPKEGSSKIALKKAVTVKPQTQIAFASQNLEDMVMYNIYKEDCCECNKKMTNPGHFNAYLCCTQCRYSTCCSKAISIHYSLFHVNSKCIYTLGTPCILENNLFCVCGFKTNSGNKMAKHLGTHKCKSAYPSKKAARAARVRTPSTVHKLELEDASSETDSLAARSVSDEGKKDTEEVPENPALTMSNERRQVESAQPPHCTGNKSKEIMASGVENMETDQSLCRAQDSIGGGGTATAPSEEAS